MRIQKLWLALAGLIAVLAFPRVAYSQQVPKVGAEYKDEIRLGFSIKMPADWGFVPPQPNEVNSLGKYPGGDMSILMNPKNGRGFIMFEIELLKFDRRKHEEPETIEGPDGTKITIDLSSGTRDFAAWAKNLKSGWTRVEKMCKTTTTNKIPTKLHVYRNEFDKEEGIAAYLLAWEYQLAPDLEVVMVATAPADDKRWGKWEGPLSTMAKSFKPLEIATKKIAVATGNTIRDARRAELQNEIKQNPGWKLYETPHYFLVTSKDDKDFMKELMNRLEAIHEVYEELYPPSLAAELRQLAKLREAAEAQEKKDGDKPEGEMTPEEWEKQQARRTRAEQGDPMERAACSVVRVCKDSDEYHHYGGPGGSAGYWYDRDEELVVYDDQTGGGRSNTWAVVNHEAFHQYVFYFFGNLSPHSWFNEGTGDYFAGYQLDGSKFKLKPFNWRLGTIKEALKSEDVAYAPLKDLVRWTQAEYYGGNKLGLDGGANYAQGWSFVYFLRTGKKNAKGWNPAWEPILDTYLRTLVETDDLTKAVDTAFAGVNWDEIEACWKRYTLNL